MLCGFLRQIKGNWTNEGQFSPFLEPKFQGFNIQHRQEK